MSEQVYRKCPRCNGLRRVSEREDGVNASHSQRCPACDGWGFVVAKTHILIDRDEAMHWYTVMQAAGKTVLAKRMLDCLDVA